jgi:hypothetical protein
MHPVRDTGRAGHDCVKFEYELRLRRLQRRIPIWQDIFVTYQEMNLFDQIDTTPLDATRCLAVHTQMATFTLDWAIWPRPEDDNPSRRGSCPIRDKDDRVVGFIHVDVHAAQRIRLSDVPGVKFIALSVSCHSSREEPVFLSVLKEYLEHVNLSKLYGCPCSTSGAVRQKTIHLKECPEHLEFELKPAWDIYQSFQCSLRVDLGVTDTDSVRHAAAKYLAQMSYYDIEGSLLHDWMHPPLLDVMMIAESHHTNGGSKIYERLGVGKIYLKRWVYASPIFETIVLA